MANKDEIIQQFVELTGVDVEIANFYLESSNWNIESALSSYYANDGEDEEAEAIDNSGLAVGSPSQLVNESVNNVNTATDSLKSKKTYTEKSKVTTLSSLKQLDSDEEDEDRRRQSFYVGGSEHGGGQQILGPPKEGKKPKQRDLEELFKSAQSHGAEVISRDMDEEHHHSNKPFSGSGFRLGDSCTDAAVPVVSRSIKQDVKQTIKINVKIWQNGFSINNGPLRSMTEPTDREFLTSLSNGLVPAEILQEHKYAKIDLSMEDHSQEEYKEPPKPKLVPFHGSGKMLGSPTPAMSSVSPSIVSSVAVAADRELVTVAVNEQEPVTQVQIRLADNSRLVARLNHGHTVGDIRRYIVGQCPQYHNSTFILMTAFPSKILNDDSVTLAAGNLLNAVVVQRLS